MGKKSRSSGKRRNAQSSSARHQLRQQQHGPEYAGNRSESVPYASSDQQNSPAIAGSNSPRGYAYTDYLVTKGGTSALRRNTATPPPPPPSLRHKQRHDSWKSLKSQHGSENRLSELLRARGASEGDGQDLPGQISISSRRSRQSARSHSGDNSSGITHEHGSLADVISHYMHGIDSENITDMLASRYYGNMTHITESGAADRLPKPMNSTLPLFSPSVAHGHRLVRAHSTNASDGSLQKRPSFANATAAAGAGSAFTAAGYQRRGSGGVSIEETSAQPNNDVAVSKLGQSAT
ncbi:hypothetical protein LPJ75_006413, partial [Coemansia sp. RSA 2598]